MHILGAALLFVAVAVGDAHAGDESARAAPQVETEIFRTPAQGEAVRAILYTKGRDDRAAFKLPVVSETVQRVRLFDRQISYRNDRKACVAFNSPIGKGADIKIARARIEAYNDDRTYDRALWIEVDGIGGYLDVAPISRTGIRGSGALAPGETKEWTVPLEALSVTPSQGRAMTVNALALLKRSGPHRICAWVSTYGSYGPGSWVTLDLEFVSNGTL